jgi:thioredoxin reductase
MSQSHLPIIVIGAGPVGLAAAAHLLQQGANPLVLEAGSSAGANIARWRHVQVFSPWTYNIDPVSAKLLEAHGWTAPSASGYPTGQELLERYVLPLAALPEIQSRLLLNTRVTGISRQGLSRTNTTGRAQTPFVVQAQTASGEQEWLARAVIDASGTYAQPNPLGASGLPALGEREHPRHFFYGIPDVLGADRARYAGRRVLVAGSGHSAFNTLLNLAVLAEADPKTAITWAIRRQKLGGILGNAGADELPERGRLGTRLSGLIERGKINLVTGFRAARVSAAAGGLVIGDGSRALEPVDEVVVATGFRPNIEMLRELRLALDEVVESPFALAPLIDPNVHSCGTVPPHGAEELRHPEPDFYMVGMKSYGRAPTFLLRTGYEQVRSVVLALMGDWEGARRVELVLPETGVCSSDANSSASCCDNRAPNVTLNFDLAGTVKPAS